MSFDFSFHFFSPTNLHEKEKGQKKGREVGLVLTQKVEGNKKRDRRKHKRKEG